MFHVKQKEREEKNGRFFSSRSFMLIRLPFLLQKNSNPIFLKNQLLLFLNGGHCQALCHEFWCDSDRLRPHLTGLINLCDVFLKLATKILLFAFVRLISAAKCSITFLRINC